MAGGVDVDVPVDSTVLVLVGDVYGVERSVAEMIDAAAMSFPSWNDGAVWLELVAATPVSSGLACPCRLDEPRR